MDTSIKTVLDGKGHQVYSIRANQTVFEAITEMDARNVGSLIVKVDEKVVGIVTERDYLRKVMLKGRSSRDTMVETIMSRDLLSVSADDSVATAMAVMTAKRCRHLPVFKEGQLDGIVSAGDLVKATIAGQQFEIHWLENYLFGR